MAPVTFSNTSLQDNVTTVSQTRLDEAIRTVLSPWENRTGPEATFRFVVQHETEQNRFQLLYQDNNRDKPPFVLMDIEIRNGKAWVLRNETETDIGVELMRAGVAPSQIVVGFLPPEVRADTDYAAS